MPLQVVQRGLGGGRPHNMINANLAVEFIENALLACPAAAARGANKIQQDCSISPTSTQKSN